MAQPKYTPEQKKRRYEATQRWRRRNPEYIKAYRKAFYQKTKDKYLPLNNKWNAENKEHSTLVRRIYYKNNYDKILAYSTARRAKTKVTIAVESICNWESRICGICKYLIEDKYHIDHKTPLSRGGLHVVENLQLTHPLCNQRKGQKLPEEYSKLTIQ